MHSCVDIPSSTPREQIFARVLETPDNRAKLQRMVDMGFHEHRARLLLQAVDFDENKALDRLL